MSAVISRIAPTPSGFLHIGNAFSFVLTWLLVRKAGGKLLLRIDDMDAARKRPEYVEDIFRTLEWLGLDYDLGPQGPDDFERHFSQRHRLELYHSVLEDLKQVPGLLYACRCSRKEIQQKSKNGLYPGTCRKENLRFDSKKNTVRLTLPDQVVVSYFELLSQKEVDLPLGKQMGDYVVWRKDGLPAYQLFSLVDDMDYGINLLIRGNDLCESTAAQLYLAECIYRKGKIFRKEAGDFMNAGFLHHPLLLNSEGEKLSKSKGAASLLKMRIAGKGPEEIYARVARFIGLPEDDFPTAQALLKAWISTDHKKEFF